MLSFRKTIISVLVAAVVTYVFLLVAEEETIDLHKNTTIHTVTTANTNTIHEQPLVKELDIDPQWQHPKLILAGTQKGGTTALLEMLNHEPNFVPHSQGGVHCKKYFEAHYWDEMLPQRTSLEGLTDKELKEFQDNMGADTISDKIIQAVRQDYAQCWEETIRTSNSTTIVTFEKTPRYIIRPHLPALIQKIAPWTKVLIVIREPVSRVYSMWSMFHARRGDQSYKGKFEPFLMEELGYLIENGLTKAPTLEEYRANRVQYTEEDFNLTYNISTRRTNRGKLIHGTLLPLYYGMYAELLTPWLEHFELANNLMVLSSDRFKEDPLGVVQELQQMMGVPTTEIDPEILEINYNNFKKSPPMRDSTKEFLQRFYKPYNDELMEVMGQEWFDWNIGNRWDY